MIAAYQHTHSYAQPRGLLLRLAVYLVLSVYIAATFRSAPPIMYAAKWGALAILATIALQVGGRRIQLAGLPVVLAFAPWFLLALVYQLHVGPTARGLGVGGGYVGLLALCFVILPSAIPSTEQLDRFERWIIHALAAMCLVSILMGLQDLDMSVVGGGSGRFRMRWGFEHVNDGGYLGALGVLLTGRQVARRRRRFVGPFILFAFMLATSGSRGAILTLLPAIGLMAVVFGAHRLGGGRILVILAIVVALLSALTLIALGPRATDMSFQNLNTATTGRLVAWRSALSHLNSPREWLIGQGAGQNVNFIGTRSHVGGSSDSFIIDLITRSGLLGLGIWIVTLVVIAILLGRRIIAAPPGSRCRGHLCFAAGLGLGAVTAALYEGFTFSIGTAYALAVWSCVGIATVHDLGFATQKPYKSAC